jgi:hypothetical protein
VNFAQQPGADLAGFVAAIALQIPAMGTQPHGFRQRDAFGNDHLPYRGGIRDTNRSIITLARMKDGKDGFAWSIVGTVLLVTAPIPGARRPPQRHYR